jgi:hypothetical protein
MKLLKVAGAILAVTSLAGAGEIADCRLVPGWEQDGPARTFAADNLFEYVNGNAEGYLAYGFLHLENLTCKAGGSAIVIDVSEMSDPDAAYGLFATNRDPQRPIAPIGMGGQIQVRSAMFCKDKYYVELTDNSLNGRGADLQAFVLEVEKRIPGRSSPPEALAWFPTDRLKAIRLIPESVLGLRLLKRGYVAEYETGKGFVVTEESAESASAVMRKLREHFGQSVPGAVGEESFQTRDRYLGGLCFFRKGRYLGGYANLPEGQDATGWAAALATRLP